MEDIRTAFEKVEKTGTVLMFHTTSLFPRGYTRTSEHFQGVQRIPGTNRLIVSGNGRTEGTSHLFLVDFASSQARAGQALGGNLRSGRPSDSDRVISVERFDTEFDHAGGFSIVGNYLAVGSEVSKRSRIHFFDVSDPDRLVHLNYTVYRPNDPAGAVALIQERDGRFLMIVGGSHSTELDFYRSSGTSLAEDPGFAHLGRWHKNNLTGHDRKWGSYQTLNMVMQKDGQLFLFGFHRNSYVFGKDYADMHQLTVPAEAGGAIGIRKVANRHLTAKDGAHFLAAAGLYVASPQDLIIYATSYIPKSGLVTVNEFYPNR